MASSVFLGVYATDSTVWKPASTSFLTSAALMPEPCAPRGATAVVAADRAD